jgi:hypothetical protein
VVVLVVVVAEKLKGKKKVALKFGQQTRFDPL